MPGQLQPVGLRMINCAGIGYFNSKQASQAPSGVYLTQRPSPGPNRRIPLPVLWLNLWRLDMSQHATFCDIKGTAMMSQKGIWVCVNNRLWTPEIVVYLLVILLLQPGKVTEPPSRKPVSTMAK